METSTGFQAFRPTNRERNPLKEIEGTRARPGARSMRFRSKGHEQAWQKEIKTPGEGALRPRAAKRPPPANRFQTTVPGSRKDRRVRARPEAGAQRDSGKSGSSEETGRRLGGA